MTLRVLVVSDTHIPDFAKRLPEQVLSEARQSDVILHAGDVTSAAVLEELSGYAPVHAAMGNGDGPDVSAWGARHEVQVDLDGIETAMLHIGGPSKGREGRLRRRFPDARLIVFGHSHIPVDVDVEGVRLFNPGSPTWKRREPVATYGVLTVERGRIESKIVPLVPS